jgi:biotin-(acetyl-CoA carboxylase) ligase
MLQSDFTAFYPQFAGFTPAVVLTEYIRQANSRFSSFTEEDAEEARRLYTAHKLTMYARVALPEGVTPSKAAIAAAGQAQQKIASKKVGEVAVTYSSGASSSSVSVQTDLADLPETTFGLQLLALLRLYSRSVYVP